MESAVSRLTSLDLTTFGQNFGFALRQAFGGDSALLTDMFKNLGNFMVEAGKYLGIQLGSAIMPAMVETMREMRDKIPGLGKLFELYGKASGFDFVTDKAVGALVEARDTVAPKALEDLLAAARKLNTATPELQASTTTAKINGTTIVGQKWAVEAERTRLVNERQLKVLERIEGNLRTPSTPPQTATFTR
jgi:hypothetical protein